MIEWASLTPEGKSHMMRQYCQNGSSASQVVEALKLGGIIAVTRNAIIGHVGRNMKGEWKFGNVYKRGIRRPKPETRLNGTIAKKINTARNKRLNGASPADVPEGMLKRKGSARPRKAQQTPLDLSNKVHFTEAMESQCRYALWDGDARLEDKFYCGAEKVRGVYCEYHANICLDGYYQTRRKAA